MTRRLICWADGGVSVRPSARPDEKAVRLGTARLARRSGPGRRAGDKAHRILPLSRRRRGQGEGDGPIGTSPVGGNAPSASCVSVPVSGGSKTLMTWTSVSALTWCRSFGPTT